MLFKVFKETQEKPRKDRNSDSAILVTKALHILESKSGIRTSVRKKSEQKLLR